MKNFNRPHRDGGGKKFGKKDFGRRDFGSRDSGRSAMYRATCAECGNSCEVPFKPSGSKPVFCNNCFRKGDNGNFRRSDEHSFEERDFDRDSGRSAMYRATCAECGNSCEVPFKPSGSKPVFCNNCFKKGGNAGSKNSEQFKEQIEILNIKLDRILKILTSPPKEVIQKESAPDPEKAVVKKAKVLKSKKKAKKADEQ